MIGVVWNMSIKSFSVCPRTHGIYKITNTKNGRFYVGRTICKKGFYGRWDEHRRDLRGNQHSCSYLQNAYNKYGENYFTFEILEVREHGEQLAELEFKYIINLEAMSYQKGYNIMYKKTETPKFVRENHPASKDFEILDPEGNLIKGKNLTQLGEELGIHPSGLNSVVTGRRKSYRGFKSPNPEFHLDRKEYRLISPDKKLVIFDNMEEFSRKIGAHENHVGLVIRGKKSHVKGYHLETPSPKNQKLLDRLFNKKLLLNETLGVIIKFVAIRAFSRKYQVSPKSLFNFFEGKESRLTKKYNWREPTEEEIKSYSIIEEEF